MTALTDATLAQLDDLHGQLATAAGGDVDRQSGAAEWDVAQVLSHLGSQAEIARAQWQSVLTGGPPPPEGFNESVWDRWNALDNAGKAAAFVESDTLTNDLLQALTPEQRETVRIPMFLPEPFTVEQTVGLRLNEVAQHAWDVDPTSGLVDGAAELLLQHLAGGLGFLLGFTAKADQVPDGTAVALGAGYVLVVEDGGARLTTDGPSPTATFTGPLEAAVRLLGGRLRPEHTPAGVSVEGSVGVDDLRRLFPGF